jgi:hypothetical protein
VSEADVPTLKDLRSKATDWRLESSTEELQSIIENADGKGTEPENSIFNPKNPEYILKGGCGS